MYLDLNSLRNKIANDSFYQSCLFSQRNGLFILEWEKELHVKADIDKSYSDSYTVLYLNFLSNSIALANKYIKAKTTL